MIYSRHGLRVFSGVPLSARGATLRCNRGKAEAARRAVISRPQGAAQRPLRALIELIGRRLEDPRGRSGSAAPRTRGTPAPRARTKEQRRKGRPSALHLRINHIERDPPGAPLMRKSARKKPLAARAPARRASEDRRPIRAESRKRGGGPRETRSARSCRRPGATTGS